MPDQSFTILEFPELRALLMRGAQTPMARSRIAALVPFEDLASLQSSLLSVAECVELRKRGVTWTFSEVTDPSEKIALVRVEGSVLEATAILELKVLCEQAMSARGSILAERDSSPELWQLVSNLPPELNRLIARIANKILPNGELDDRASPELARIRHDITRLRSRITRTLEGVMRKSGEAIQDELVTIRNDRFVIPVKADHRARVNGVAHGYSSSGATAFVEPLETIEANNELQALHEGEAREIARILLALTDELRGQVNAIEVAADAVATLDFINAKAIFHQRFNCAIPEVDGDALDLNEARHPLLEENLRATAGAVVPVSFSLDDKTNTMVISGANAGGKTVVLKTAGLLALMALSGIPVPAKSARVPFYKSVLADIGDHQSLAANLSTFTSHVANISRMVELCQAPALVLLDEVGTGTDPEEGSALGVAVVDQFRKECGAHVLATTHYSGLKMYAGNEGGVLNASVEFDEKTLRPTYRLIVGVAGSSSGLEIARRFGIPDKVIDTALESVKDSSRQSYEYLRRIKQEAEEAEALRLALEEERAAVAEKFASLEKQAERRERERQSTFESALQKNISDFEKQSRELLSKIEDRAERLKVEREAQKRAGELKRAMRVSLEERSTGVSSGSNTRSREGGLPPPSRGIRVMRDGAPISKAAPVVDQNETYETKTHRNIAVGDKVKLKSFGSIGIVDQIKDDVAEVRVKSLRLREKLDNLELVELTAPVKSKTEKFASLKKASETEVHLKHDQENGRSELNVIGKTTDQAVDAVDKFLDEASMASLSQIRIIHGHGTGALRKAIAEMLKDHPHVVRFVPAPQDQGGSGATIVELKQ
ncbi:MAG TPA: Smr/MutS family protein [Pyrinomonadaceae bacterium]|nr:Smr/MutS family protein [Pyrinomonadaceae bacterium]